MTEHTHGLGCINTYPDCDYPADPGRVVTHKHGGVAHVHLVTRDDHYHYEHDVPDSPGNYPALYDACTIETCENATDRRGQPCDNCHAELGVG